MSRASGNGESVQHRVRALPAVTANHGQPIPWVRHACRVNRSDRWPARTPHGDGFAEQVDNLVVRPWRHADLVHARDRVVDRCLDRAIRRANHVVTPAIVSINVERGGMHGVREGYPEDSDKHGQGYGVSHRFSPDLLDPICDGKRQMIRDFPLVRPRVALVLKMPDSTQARTITTHVGTAVHRAYLPARPARRDANPASAPTFPIYRNLKLPRFEAAVSVSVRGTDSGCHNVTPHRGATCLRTLDRCLVSGEKAGDHQLPHGRVACVVF